jgi:hypothetical protein
MSKHLRHQKGTNLIAIHTVVSYKNAQKINPYTALILIVSPFASQLWQVHKDVCCQHSKHLQFSVEIRLFRRQYRRIILYFIH